MADVLWERTGLRGSLSMGKSSVAVELDVACDSHGELEFRFSQIPLNSDSKWLVQEWHETSRYAQMFRLRVSHDDDTIVSTDGLFLTSCGIDTSKDDGSTISLQGSTAWLEVTQPVQGQNEAPVAAYRVIGMEGFRPLQTDVPEGRLTISAATRPPDHSKMTGNIRIERTKAQNGGLSQWIENCDKRAELVLDVFSLVLDCSLWWSVRELFDPTNGTVSLLFRGQTPQPSRPQYPILSDLHLQPAIDLIRKHTEEFREEVGMGNALALFLMRPPYVEPRFTAAMAGLDQMLQRFAEHHPSGTLINKAVFRSSILPHLEHALANSIDGLGEEVAADTADALRAKLKELNRTTLRNTLLAFLDHHNVPLAGITQEQIKNLVRVRNDLFHGRDFKPRNGECLSDHLAVLHELMQRVFLTLLGFTGDRWTYLNGPEWVKFPPTEKH